MSKKLLALLIAVSTCCAFGCSDDDSDSCKTGEKRCDGNSTQTCVNGNWSTGTPCANGCDKATGVCKEKAPETGACTTAGEKRCSGKQLQECKGGNWSKVEDCKDSCDDATKACKPVDPGTKPKEGDACDKSTFQQVCINGGANALVCWDNVVKKWNCANNDCKANADEPLQVVCKRGGNTGGGSGTGGTDLEDCSATSNAKCKAACAADGKGYYWDTTADTLRTKDCTTKNQTCHLEGSTVSCLDEQTDEACDKKTNPAPTCIENNTKVKYCDGTTSKYAIKACNTCVVIEGSYGCDGIESLDPCTSTSNERCRGVCTSDTEGYYWSEGLRPKKCKSGQKCVATKTGYVGCEKS